MKTFNAIVILFAVCFLAPSANGGTIVETSPLVPSELDAGDTFHLVFLTDTAATPNSIGSTNTAFNGWVTAEAADSTYAGLDDFAWFVIGSMHVNQTNRDARDNAVVGTDNPVYRLDNVKVADD